MLRLCAEPKLNKVEKRSFKIPHYLLFPFASCLTGHELSKGQQQRLQHLGCWVCTLAACIRSPWHSTEPSLFPGCSPRSACCKAAAPCPRGLALQPVPWVVLQHSLPRAAARPTHARLSALFWEVWGHQGCGAWPGAEHITR